VQDVIKDFGVGIARTKM